MINKIIHWFQDDTLKRLLKNASFLLSGNIGASCLGMISLTLTVRALGPSQFGTLALIQTYIIIIDRLINFQSWQALIKYGAEALESKKVDDFKALIKFGTLVDVISAMLGAVIAASAVYWIGNWKGWNPDIVRMTSLYSLVVLFNLTGTPTAILRLFDKFKLFAFQQIIASGFKVICVCIAFFAEAGLYTFLVIWMLTDIMGYILLLFLGWKELYLQNFRKTFSSSIKGISSLYPGLFKFIVSSNLNGSAVAVTKQLDKMVLAVAVSVQAVGIYKLVQSVSSLLLRLGDPLYNSIYPQINELLAQSRLSELRKLLSKSTLLMGILAAVSYIVLCLVLKTAVTIVFGADFVKVASVTPAYIIGPFVAIVFFYAHPLMLAYNEATKSLIINAINSIIYLTLLYPIAQYGGLIGVALLFTCYMTSSVLLRILYVQWKYRLFIPDKRFSK